MEFQRTISKGENVGRYGLEMTDDVVGEDITTKASPVWEPDLGSAHLKC